MADVNTIVRGTSLEKWLRGSSGQNVDDRGDYYHVTLYYAKGGHISGNVGKNGRVWDVHGTLYAYEADGRRATTGEDIVVQF